MPGFQSFSFLIAGAVAAFGPVLIHLLNRRRHRVVPWAAMDFVREALTKTRRFLRVRDLLLMFLRVAAVLTFGLALSRPFVASRGASADPHQPVHAVIVVDTSLSRSLEDPGGKVLSRACQRAKELIDNLPGGSRISVLPLCGPVDRIEREAFRSPQDARSALDRIEIVDHGETAARLIPLVQDALAQAPELTAHRIVFFGDQQQVVWPVAAQESVARAFPEVEVIRISPMRADNTWVAALELEDDFAEPQSEIGILATIRCEGAPRENVAISLQVDGETAATQYVDLSPGEARVVRFLHQFGAAGNAGYVQHVPVTVSLENDRLPLDDSRSLVVPVLSAFPVVFIDQYGGEGEDARQHRLGETYFLRQLLSPGGEGGSGRQGAFSIRYITVENLTRTLLQDARLVVIAGIEAPGSAAGLLRDYVRQGGQLLITAGGGFSPADWMRDAWDEGRGILPVPLDKDLMGSLPTSATMPKPFFLDPSTMTDDVFQIAGASRDDLDELYRTPVFFVTAMPGPNGGIKAPNRSRSKEPAEGESEPGQDGMRWLQWRPERLSRHRSDDSEDGEDDSQPRVLARFSNDIPFLIERDIGEGTLLMALSGIGSDWNNLPRTNAVVLLDRLVRKMLGRGLSRRSAETFTLLKVTLAPRDRRTQFEGQWAHGPREAVAVEALGPDEFGIVLRNLTRRGIYRVTAVPDNSVAPASTGTSATADLVFAVNGPEPESNLAAIDSHELADRISPDSPLVTLDEGSDLPNDAGPRREFWKTFLWCTLACLLMEMTWLSLVNAKAGQTRSPAGG